MSNIGDTDNIPLNLSEYSIYASTGILALVAIICSVHLMVRHLNNWTDPKGQISIVRIVMMVPIYALTSWLAIICGKYAVYFNLFRDSYEALVLYEFFCLIIHYFDKEASHYFSNLTTSESNGNNSIKTFGDYFSEYSETPWPFPFCFLPNIIPGVKFFALIKACVIQYVFIKPVLSFLAVLLHMKAFYHTGYFIISDAYLWITVICNVSMSISLYMLVIFYLFIADVIEKYEPLYKFLSIKVLIFFIFWQSLIITVLYYFNFLPLLFDWDSNRSSVTLENILVCAEMFIISITHLWIYSYEPYKILSTVSQGVTGV